jgi:hypothetical protein
LLAKQQDFWKGKSHDATTWALFAPINALKGHHKLQDDK